jgi:hypothetical protein
MPSVNVILSERVAKWRRHPEGKPRIPETDRKISYTAGNCHRFYTSALAVTKISFLTVSSEAILRFRIPQVEEWIRRK